MPPAMPSKEQARRRENSKRQPAAFRTFVACGARSAYMRERPSDESFVSA